MAAEVMSVCPSSLDSAPRCDICLLSAFEIFRRLFAAEEAVGRRVDGASGAEDLEVDQRPTVWSSEAESMCDVGACTEIELIFDLCPYNSRAGTIDALASFSV
jgi:hypothetical protein